MERRTSPGLKDTKEANIFRKAKQKKNVYKIFINCVKMRKTIIPDTFQKVNDLAN